VGKIKNIDYSSILKIPKSELKNKIAGVYKITCTVNGKVYIGRSDDIYKRWKGHVYSMLGRSYGNKHLLEDVSKLGIENFSFEVLEVCESGFEAYYGNVESKYMEKYDSQNLKKGYNIIC
jgi:group I intron endonuclease